jgi:hypothetical protein
VPPDDRLQLIDQHEPDEFIYDPDYLGVHRTRVKEPEAVGRR